MSDDEVKPEKTEVSTVRLKIPQFWGSDPVLWFAQVEAQFALSNITRSITKFNHVIAALPQEFAMEVRDLLVKPPSEEPYESLKEKLVQRTTLSEQKRLQQLLTAEELGDRKPSQLLRRMSQLIGEDKLDQNILIQLFMQRMPANVQAILAGTRDDMSIEQLAEIADKILEVNPTPFIAHTSSVASVLSQDNSGISELRKEIADLSLQVRNLSRQVTDMKNSRPRSFSRPRPRSRSSTPNRGSDTLCWYHRKFGNSATNCRSPCTFNTEAKDQASN